MTTENRPVTTLGKALNRAIRRRKYEFTGCCAMALALSSPVFATGDADGDGIPDSVEGYYAGVVNGFEQPVIASDFVFVNQTNIPDWSTSAPAEKIEVWRTDFRDVPSYEGFQHAEINATDADTLYVELASIPGSVLSWKIAHRGRDGTDTALVSAGAPGDAGELLETMVTDNTRWELYSGTYTVPAGQTTTRFSFAAVGTGGSANFIDGLEITGESRDSDMDGTPDYLDEDSDDDGIPDNFETAFDTDGDDLPNYLDSDSDADGIPDDSEGNIDTDGDDAADYLDTDSDDDGLLDADEGDVDTDGDGKPDYQDVDSDADGIPDATEGNVDTDGDGEANYIDTDSDGDGISDAVEGITDSDGDGQPDYLTATTVTDDLDTDADGIPDSIEGTIDTDGDGIADYLDLDSDNDSIPDAAEGSGDLDGDGTANYQDLDVDNDGIADIIEAHADIADAVALDADMDGVVDGTAESFGPNGLADAVETAANSGQIGYAIANSDNDSRPDYKDLDSDNDSIFDVTEMRLLDADLNGVVDEEPASYSVPADQDSDGVMDFRDLDSDNDGLTDLVEAANADADGDGRVDNFNDADNDGVDDSIVAVELADLDGDGLTNQLDLDSDQDSLPDLLEGGGSDADANGVLDAFSDEDGDGLSDAIAVSPLPGDDSDGDGVQDYLDLDSDNDGEFDLVSAGNEDVDGNGMVDSFEDPDNDGLFGSNSNPVTVATDNAGIITGVSGGFGCSAGNGRSPVDPMFPGMLLLAGLGFIYRKRQRSD